MVGSLGLLALNEAVLGLEHGREDAGSVRGASCLLALPILEPGFADLKAVHLKVFVRLFI